MLQKVIPFKQPAASIQKESNQKPKKKSHMAWSWIIMIVFLALSVLDLRFGLGAVLCMTVPMIHALRGHGKIHCSHYCPRGSLFGKLLQRISLRNSLPAFMRTTVFKNALLSLMVIMLTISLSHNHDSINAIGMALFRFMAASLAVGLTLGIFYQPRSWCQVCPMGHATSIIANYQKKTAA
jgi:hypothetical protein